METYDDVVEEIAKKIYTDYCDKNWDFIGSHEKHQAIQDTRGILKEIFKNPLRYIKPTNQTLTKEAQTGGIGTGFIITSDSTIISGQFFDSAISCAFCNTIL